MVSDSSFSGISGRDLGGESAASASFDMPVVKHPFYVSSTSFFCFDRKRLSFCSERAIASGVDTKKQVEVALEGCGQNRRWLATATKYSYFSVRDCLAPDGKKLSKRMFQAFMAAIAKESALPKQLPQELPDRISIEVEPEKRKLYVRVSQSEKYPDVSEWMIAELDKAAKKWAAAKQEAGRNIKGLDADQQQQRALSHGNLPTPFLNEESGHLRSIKKPIEEEPKQGTGTGSK